MIKALESRAMVLPFRRSEFEQQCDERQARLEKALAAEREARELEKSVRDGIPQRLKDEWLPVIAKAAAEGKERVAIEFELDDPQLPHLMKYAERAFGLQGYTTYFLTYLGRERRTDMSVSWGTPRLTWLKYQLLKIFSCD